MVDLLYVNGRILEMKGIGHVEVREGGVRIIADMDLIRYYLALINFYEYKTVKLQLPLHGAHITILNPKIHKGAKHFKAIPYNKKEVEFEYYPENAYISAKNYWLPVTCEFADRLIQECEIDNGAHWWGLHLTIANKKFNGQ